MNTQFANEVDEGLSKSERTLPSKYFYDKIGDELFVKIMHCSEYYLTRAEFEIFSQQTEEIIAAFDSKDEAFDVIELGAGDGTKTIQLLKKLDPKLATYRPIDISVNALNKLEGRVGAEVPELNVLPFEAEYFSALRSIKGNKKKVVLFLGSNLGNMLDEQASSFMEELSNSLNPGDMVLLGLDQKKSKDIVLPAYNDSDGYTRAFNLNLLRRINKELGGDFDLDQWEHSPEYDEEEGVAKSYLKSKKEQEVHISSLNKSYRFTQGERIHTEISRKYDSQVLKGVLQRTTFKVERLFQDSQQYFTDVLLKKQ